MSKQLAESLIHLAGLYFIVAGFIALGGKAVMYLQSHLSDRMEGMGLGDAFWLAASAAVSILVGAIVLKKSGPLAGLVVREE